MHTSQQIFECLVHAKKKIKLVEVHDFKFQIQRNTMLTNGKLISKKTHENFQMNDTKIVSTLEFQKKQRPYKHLNEHMWSQISHKCTYKCNTHTYLSTAKLVIFVPILPVNVCGMHPIIFILIAIILIQILETSYLVSLSPHSLFSPSLLG